MPEPMKKVRRRHRHRYRYPPTDLSTNLIIIGNKRKAEEIVEKKVDDICGGVAQPAVDTMTRNKKRKRVKKQKNRQEKTEEEPKKLVATEAKIVAADDSCNKRGAEEIDENQVVSNKNGERYDDSDDWEPPEEFSSKEQPVLPTFEKPDEEPKKPVEAKTNNDITRIEINLGSPFPPLPGGSKLVFMNNLSPSIQESDVVEFFKDAGKIDWVRLKSMMLGDRYSVWGHVRFHTSEAAQKALKRNKEELIGCAVELFESDERTIFDMLTPSIDHKYLFMGNLSPDIKEEDIIEFFKDDGEVVSVDLIHAGGFFEGYGHVEFVSSTVAHKAIRRYGKMLQGRRVELVLATEKTLCYSYTPRSGKPPRFGVERGPGFGPTKDRCRCEGTLPVSSVSSRCRSCLRPIISV